MICSEPSSFGLDVGDELHELVGLPVQVQVVQRLERERRVAHPRVAVVPVALAARRLGKRGRQRRDRRAGRHVRQSLDRERRALDGSRQHGRGCGLGRASARQKRTVAAMRASASSTSLGTGQALGPRQRAVRLVTRLEDMPCPHAAALDSEREIRLEADRLAGSRRVGDVPIAVDERPRRRLAPVVEDGLADELDLDVSLEALDGADEHVVGVVVGRRPRVRRDRRPRRPAAPWSARRGRRSSPHGVFQVVSRTFVPGS